jgi:hypothetical protein
MDVTPWRDMAAAALEAAEERQPGARMEILRWLADQHNCEVSERDPGPRDLPAALTHYRAMADEALVAVPSEHGPTMDRLMELANGRDEG